MKLLVGNPGQSCQRNCSPQGDSRKNFARLPGETIKYQVGTDLFLASGTAAGIKAPGGGWLLQQQGHVLEMSEGEWKSHMFSVNLIALSGGWRGPAEYFVRVYIVLDPLPLRIEKRKPICLIRPLPLDMCIGFYIKAFNSYVHIWAGAIVSPCDGLRSRMLMLSKGTLFNVYCDCINRVTRAKWDVNDLWRS